MSSRLPDADIANYHEDGLLFLRGLFDAEETDLLRRAMEEDPEIQDHFCCAPIKKAAPRRSRSGTGRRRIYDSPPLRADRRNGGSSDW